MIEGLHKSDIPYRILEDGAMYYYAISDEEWRKFKLFRGDHASINDLKIPKEFL